MKKIIYLAFLPALLGNAEMRSVSESTMELILSEGQLHELMQDVKAYTGNTLILKGEATAFDLTALRNLPPAVVSLDMSGLKIKGVKLMKDSWFGQQSFDDNEIPSYMLLGTDVENIKLPEGIKKIGDGAFSSTPVREVKGGAVSWMGKGIFHGCRNLESVDFSESRMSVIPERTFSGCVSLKNISLPTNVIYIGSRAFEGTAIEKADFPKVNDIGEYAFANARHLEEVSFAKGCRIGEGAFFGTGSLSSISVNPGETAALSFAGANIEGKIEIAGESVGEGAYAGSKASEILFTGETKNVGAKAFYSMSGLKEVNMTCSQSVPDADENSFEGTDVERVVLMVRKGEAEKWQQAPVWQRFIIMEDESGINDVEADNGNVEISRSGNMILISADCDITEVSIYSTDGMLLSTSSPGREYAEITFPAEKDVVIVRAVAGGSVKIGKIM